MCVCVCVSGWWKKSPSLTCKGGSESFLLCPGPGASLWSLSDGDCQLVSLCLCILSELPSICSPQGQGSR